MSRIYTELSNLFKYNLTNVAKSLGYSKYNLLILAKDFKTLQLEFPEVWNSLMSCRHQKDKRTITEYALDLVASWVYEDVILSELSKFFDIELNGTDKKREILSSSKVKTDADYLITSNGNSTTLELVNSYTNYWKSSGKIDLRDNKFKKLERNNSLLVCIDIFNKDFFILDVKKNKTLFKYIPYHELWGKPAYQLDINNMETTRLSLKNLTSELNKKIF
ncbi:MAG: hypothetical protein CMD02_04025 [Flavobacteriales bacterium]|nr:hypothetical protein [Flavobacteriales bacterium]|tara:strand:+ start:774 stop:1433 length:660 start_codon:yes stop_codon:yes gene_type:complete